MTDDEKRMAKKLYDKEYRKKNKDKLNEQKKKWAQENPDKILKIKQKYKEAKKITDRKYAINNKEKIKEQKKKWAQENPDKVKSANAKYHKNRLKNDELYKLKHIISSIIRDSLKRKGYCKSYRSVEILGCSIDIFKNYIESKFESWMSWENYGRPEDGIYELNKTWDIDHVIPLRSASSEEDIIKLNHYTNLQPLCSYHNRFIKKDRY